MKRITKITALLLGIVLLLSAAAMAATDNSVLPGTVPGNINQNMPLQQPGVAVQYPTTTVDPNAAYKDQRVVLADPAPWNLDELKQAVDVKDPAQVAAYYVWAVNRLVWNYDDGMGMMKYLFADLEPFGKGFTEGGLSGLGGWDTSMNCRLKDSDYRWLPRAYLEGANSANGFVPTRPITVVLQYNKANTESINSQATETGRTAVVYRVKSNAAGNLAEIVVSRFEGSDRWYVTSGTTSAALFYDQRSGVSSAAMTAAAAVADDGTTQAEHTAKYGGAELPFTDVTKDGYAYDAIGWAYNTGVTTGTSATTFGPADSCTRGQVVTFLWRAAGKPEPQSTVNPFKDVKESDYFYKPVLWALQEGITAGATADTFAPGQTCSSAHIITFLFRAMDMGTDGWYQEAEKWAQSAGLLEGTGIAVSPSSTCPRGAVVTFLYRSYKR